MADAIRADEMKQRANEFFRAKDYPNAVEFYSRSLQQKPDSVVYSNRAQAYLNLERYVDALADANEALEVDPENDKARFRKSVALFKLERYQQAVRNLEMCRSVAPRDCKIKQLLKDTIGCLARKTALAQQKWGSIRIDQISIGAGSKFELVEVDEKNSSRVQTVQLSSWQELSKRMDGYQMKIRLFIINGVNISRDAMTFFRAVDPICFSGEVHFSGIDFSPFAGLFQELFDIIFKFADIVQFIDPRGLRGYSLSNAFSAYGGLRHANLVSVLRSNKNKEELHNGHKLDLQKLMEYLHNTDTEHCRAFITMQEYFRVSITAVWDCLKKEFMNGKKKSPYELEILCSNKPDLCIASQLNPVTKEALSLITEPHPIEGASLLDGGYRVIIRRY